MIKGILSMLERPGYGPRGQRAAVEQSSVAAERDEKNPTKSRQIFQTKWCLSVSLPLAITKRKKRIKTKNLGTPLYFINSKAQKKDKENPMQNSERKK